MTSIRAFAKSQVGTALEAESRLEAFPLYKSNNRPLDVIEAVFASFTPLFTLIQNETGTPFDKVIHVRLKAPPSNNDPSQCDTT